MDYTKFFYTNILGKYPHTDMDNYFKTACTIEWLLECGIKKSELVQLLYLLPKNIDHLSYDKIPSKLWDGSLIEKDTYYIHNELKLVSPPPYINSKGEEVITDFYIEPKVRFTLDDLLNYFYINCSNYYTIKDDSKFKGQLNSLLRKYKHLDADLNELDIILHLIDNARFKNLKIFEPFNLDKSENLLEVIETLKSKIAEARLIGADRFIWRTKPKN